MQVWTSPLSQNYVHSSSNDLGVYLCIQQYLLSNQLHVSMSTHMHTQEYLSGMKIVHRDLATRNVLIDKEMFLKISDFGLSRDIYSDSSYHMAHNKDRLPVRWMAIESIIDRDFSVTSDV